MIDSGEIKSEPVAANPVASGSDNLAGTKYFAKRDIMELAFIALYPVFLPLPILNVVAGILLAYALLSLTARGKLSLALGACVITFGLGSVVQIGAVAPEFNMALIIMTVIPTLALAIGFRLFSKMGSAFMLMTIVTVATVAIVYSLSADIFGAIFDNFKEITEGDPNLSAPVVTQVLEALRWLTPALIATQILMPIILSWYLAPALERILTSGKSVDLATSTNFHWLTLTQWRLPYSSLTLLFFFAAGRLISNSLELEELKRICDNLLLVAVIVFSVAGFAMVEYTFRRFRVSWLMRTLFYGLAVLSALPGTVFLALVGLGDTQFDFRNRLPMISSGNNPSGNNEDTMA